MNQLSLYLYFSDIAENLLFVAKSFAFFGFFGLLFLSGVTFAAFMEYDDDSAIRARPMLKRLMWILWPIWLVLLVLAVGTPSKETIRLIAASQATEQVVQSEQGKVIMGKIVTILNDQLDGLTKKEK